MLGGILGLANGARLWNEGAVFIHPEMMALSMAAYVFGFVSLVGAAAYSERYHTLAQYFLLVTYLTFAVGMGYNHIRYLNPGYGTDAIAFNHFSAELVMRGENPYAHSMEGSFERFGMEERLHTVDVEGKKVQKLSYPALSFLLYTPFVALGVDNMNWVHLLAHLAALLLLFFLSPGWLRPITPLVMFMDLEFIHFSTGGVTDVMFLPFLILTVFFWRKNRLWAALLWAAACCIKQHPWFLAPFMAAAIVHEHIAESATDVLKALGRYFGPAAGVFGLVNVVFFIGSPGGWFSSVFTPLGKPLIMYGAGLVNLTTGGGAAVSRSVYTLLAMATLVALVSAFYLYYEKISAAMWVLPGVVLWMAPRSLTSYFIYWAPLIALAVADQLNRVLAQRDIDGPDRPIDEDTGDGKKAGGDARAETGKDARAGGGANAGGGVGAGGGAGAGEKDTASAARTSAAAETDSGDATENAKDSTRALQKTQAAKRGQAHLRQLRLILRRHSGLIWIAAVPLVVFSTVAVAALITPGTVEAKVLRAVDGDQLGVVDRADVRVENRTDEAFVPRFAVRAKGNALYFWKVQKEQQTAVKPGHSKVYRIAAKSPLEAPPVGQRFRFRIYGASKKRFFLSAPFGPVQSHGLIHNGGFAVWEKGRRAPLSWRRSLYDSQWSVSRQTIRGRKAICLAVRQQGDRDWQRVWIGQKKDARTKSVGFKYYSRHDPLGLYRPVQLTGLELEFPGNRIALFAPSHAVPKPILAIGNKMLLAHLPYKRARWQSYTVDVDALRRLFGYRHSVSFDMRFVLSRHHSRPGAATACYDSASAAAETPADAFSVLKHPALNNPRLAHWRAAAQAPLGWKLEEPQTKKGWRVMPLAQAEQARQLGEPAKGRFGAVFEITREKDAGPEWTRLALAQKVILPTRKLVFRVCTLHRTRDLAEPRVLVGVEIVDRRAAEGKKLHVYTLSTVSGQVRKNAMTIHGVKPARMQTPASAFVYEPQTGPLPETQRRVERGCGDIVVDLTEVRDPHPGVRLLLNVHRSLGGPFRAVFKPIRWQTAFSPE